MLLCHLYRCPEEFEILHGDHHGLSDTVKFLKSLVDLDPGYDSERNSEKRQMREHKAAAGLFSWEVLSLLTILLTYFFVLLTSEKVEK